MTKVVAFASVGSLSPALPVGSIVIPDDFYNPNNILSFYDDARGHRYCAVLCCAVLCCAAAGLLCCAAPAVGGD